MLGRKRDLEETDDILVVFDDEQRTSDIKRITDITEEAVIVMGEYKVPIGDCELTTGQDGRVFFYRAPSKSIKETKRLAELEKNHVLREISNYRYAEEKSFDLSKYSMLAVTIISVLMLGLSSCQG